MKFIVAIGHGGINKDFGITEEAWNEDFSLNYFIPFMKENGINYAIVDKDDSTKLADEIDYISDDDDIMLFLHANYSENRDASGTTILYDTDSTKSKDLATQFDKAIVDSLGLQNNGVNEVTQKDKNSYLLLKNSKIPAVIIEAFFISNDDDVRTVDKKVDQFTKAIGEVMLKNR